MKYSGANWLNNYRQEPLSPLAVRVANILGQLYQGIYHLESYVLSRRTQWGDDSVRISLPCLLATYDFPRLTTLILCCHAAGVGVKVSGRTADYIGLLFFDQSDLSLDRVVELPDQIGLSLQDAAVKLFRRHSAGLLDRRTDCKWIRYVLTGDLSISELTAWTLLAHSAAMRVEIGGRSAGYLCITLSHRVRSGLVHERHPNFSTALNSLRGIWNIDYTSSL